jgi:glycogen operon protein
MGDEVRRSQGGNNNAYCLDGEGSWLDWRLRERHAGLQRFVKGLAAFRLGPDIVGEPVTLNQLLQWARIEWHGVQLGRPDWSDHSHSLAYTLGTPHWRFVLHAMFNAWREPLTFELPRGEPYRWQRCVDTALPSPDDYRPLPEAPLVTEGTYRVAPRSCVVLVSPLPGVKGEEPA